MVYGDRESTCARDDRQAVAASGTNSDLVSFGG
jgi:hypothetical protein